MQLVAVYTVRGTAAPKGLMTFAWVMRNHGKQQSQGSFPATDKHVLNRPLGRLLHSFARTTHSLCTAPHRSICSLRSRARSLTLLTHFAHSLVRWLKFINMCSHCNRVQWEQTRFWSSKETRPQSLKLR